MTAVVFLLVLLLISGWSVDPLAAAAAVTCCRWRPWRARSCPAPRRRGRWPAACWWRAASPAWRSCPRRRAFWTIAPQLLAGCGIGMALPALAGELLPERTRGEVRRAAVAAPRGHHAGAGGARAAGGRRAGRPGAARARARHRARAGRRPAADRQDRAGPAAVRRTSRPTTRATRCGRRSRASAGASRPATATCSAACSGSTASSAEAARCSTGSSGSRTVRRHAREAARGLDRLLGTDRAEGLLDDLKQGRGRPSPEQLGPSRQARRRPRRRGAGRRRTPPSARRSR